MSQVYHARVPKSHCPSHPRVPGLLGISQTCPKCPMVECPNPTVHPIPESRDYLGYPRHVPSVPWWSAQIPLSIPSQSPGTTWDIPDMSQVSHGGVPKSHCPSHPRVPGLLGISQTCPKCPMVECPSPTVHPIPESRDYLGYPRHVPSVPWWSAQIPLSIPSQSPGTTWDIPDMSQVSHGGVPKSHCPSHPRAPGLLGISQTCPKCPMVECPNPPVLPIPESRDHQTCPKCPMVECPNPTVLPIPESRDYLGYPRHVPSVP